MRKPVVISGALQPMQEVFHMSTVRQEVVVSGSMYLSLVYMLVDSCLYLQQPLVPLWEELLLVW